MEKPGHCPGFFVGDGLGIRCRMDAYFSKGLVTNFVT